MSDKRIAKTALSHTEQVQSKWSERIESTWYFLVQICQDEIKMNFYPKIFLIKNVDIASFWHA